MTIREWLATRNPAAPPPLMDRIVAMLGPRVDAPVATAANAFLDAARVALSELLRDERFERHGALDLLAIDALMTFTYEIGAERGGTAADLDILATRGADSIAQLAPSHG